MVNICLPYISILVLGSLVCPFHVQVYVYYCGCASFFVFFINLILKVKCHERIMVLYSLCPFVVFGRSRECTVYFFQMIEH